MLKIFVTAAALLSGAALHAHQLDLGTADGHECLVEIERFVRVGPDFLEVREDDSDSELLFRYRAPDRLTVDGAEITMDPGQQQLMQAYHTGLHQSGRDLALISLEAVDIALQGISIALTTLAGVDHPDVIEMQETSMQIRDQAEARFSAQGDVYLLGDDWMDEYFDETVERDLEPKIEKLATESAGNIAWHALKAVFTGGRSIERKAEEMAEQMEPQIEARASRLEQRAQSLCKTLKTVEQTEQELHRTIPALERHDIVDLSSEH